MIWQRRAHHLSINSHILYRICKWRMNISITNRNGRTQIELKMSNSSGNYMYVAAENQFNKKKIEEKNDISKRIYFKEINRKKSTHSQQHRSVDWEAKYENCMHDVKMIHMIRSERLPWNALVYTPISRTKRFYITHAPKLQ